MNYYKILGLQENATLDEIKNAYRVLAKKYHPDLNDDRNAEFLFLQIKEAYEILRNPITRAEYDHNLNKNNFYHSNSNSNNDTTGKTSDMKSTQNSLGTFLLVLVFTLVAIVFIPLVSNPNSAVDAIEIAKDNAPYNPETFARLGTVKKIYGWNSIHISRNTYFVSYEFDENDTDKQNGYSFYCFEVNISTKKVTEIIGNQILEEKYKKLGYID